jgi:hypothetical protein
VVPYPSSFHGRLIQTNGTALYVRVGGTGAAVVLLHGYRETGDMWEPLAVKLAADRITGTTAALSRRKQPSIPPYRLMQTGGYAAKFGVFRIDEQILLEPGNNARHDEQ